MATLTFTVDSALLAELGEKLVESAHVALVELVKNSYDADATKVTVRFTPQPRGGPDIEVSDNGSGMTFAEVQQYWMRIATTHKQKKDVSQKYGRPRTGRLDDGQSSGSRAWRLKAVARVHFFVFVYAPASASTMYPLFGVPRGGVILHGGFHGARLTK